MMNNVIYTRIRKDEGLLSSKVSVSGVGAGPGVVTQATLATIGGVEFPDFTPDIRVSIRADSGGHRGQVTASLRRSYS